MSGHADQEQALGSDPDTLATRAALVTLLREAGRFDAVTCASEELLPNLERVLGRDHPDTLATWGSSAARRNNALSTNTADGATPPKQPSYRCTRHAQGTASSRVPRKWHARF